MTMTNTTETTAGRNFLTLAEFVGTKVEVPDIQQAIGFSDDGGVRGGFVYDQCAYIERDLNPATGKPTGEFFLCIERSTWNDPDLAKLERILWAEHYLFETGGGGDVELRTDDGTLDDFIRGVCDAYAKPVDGDLFGVLFSSNRTWSPGEAREKIVGSFTYASADDVALPMGERLQLMADRQADDVPATPDAEWKGAVRGMPVANVRVAAKANSPMIPMATLGRAHIESGVGVQSGGVGVQSGPSNFARMTADTLDAGACNQIVRFLRSSAKQERVGLDPLELRAMVRAADALETILSWQTPKAVA